MRGAQRHDLGHLLRASGDRPRCRAAGSATRSACWRAARRTAWLVTTRFPNARQAAPRVTASIRTACGWASRLPRIECCIRSVPLSSLPTGLAKLAMPEATDNSAFGRGQLRRQSRCAGSRRADSDRGVSAGPTMRRVIAETETSAFSSPRSCRRTMRIEPRWIDYNGHLNMAYYSVLLRSRHGRGLRGDRPRAGLRAGARCVRASRRNGTCSTSASCGSTIPSAPRSSCIDFDDKRIHVYLELRHARELWLSATAETHEPACRPGGRAGSLPFPPDIIASLAIMKAAHRGLPQPEGARPGHRHPAKRAASGRPGVH